MNKIVRTLDGGSPAVRVLILNGLVGSFGSGLFLAGYILYFTRGVGLSAWQVTGGMAFAGVVGLVGSVPVGALADRYGHRRTLILLHSLRALAYIAFAWVGTFPQFLAVAATVTLCDKASQSLSQALTGGLTSERERAPVLAKVRAAQNVGMSVGALLAAVVLETNLTGGFRVLTIINGLSFIFTASQLWRLRTLYPPASRVNQGAVQHDTSLEVNKWRQLGLSAMNGVLSIHSTVLFTAFPLWISIQKDAPTSLFSFVLAINTILTAVGQVWCTRFTSTPRRATQAAVVAGFSLAVCCAIMAFTHNMDPLWVVIFTCVAAVLLTAAENLHAAAAWEISFALAPADARGAYLAVFGLGQSGRDIGGPPLINAAVVGLGPPGWLLLGLMFVFGAGGFRYLSLRLTKERSASDERVARLTP